MTTSKRGMVPLDFPFIVHAHEKYCITRRIAPFQGFLLSGRRLAKHAPSVGFGCSCRRLLSSSATDRLALFTELQPASSQCSRVQHYHMHTHLTMLRCGSDLDKITTVRTRLCLSRLPTITPPSRLSHVRQRHLPAFADLLLARFQVRVPVPVAVPLYLKQSLSQSCAHAAIPLIAFSSISVQL